MKSKSFNVWPYVTVISLLLGVLACFWTVKIAQDHPVEFDNQYRQRYDYVNQNINEILEMSEVFDKQGYSVNLKSTPQKGSNTLSFQLLNKANQPVSDASLDLLVTRPATTKYDIPLGKLEFQNGVYQSQPVVLTQPGAWVLNVEIQVGQLTVNRLFEVFL